MLEYTITQLISQGNVQFSNSNSEAKPLVINEENQKVSLDLGTSDTPSNLTLNLNFNYNENRDRTVAEIVCLVVEIVCLVEKSFVFYFVDYFNALTQATERA